MANKIELYLADEDDIYLNRLSVYLIGHKDMFQIHAFSQRKYLEQALGTGSARVDILAVSEEMNIPAVQRANASAKILLTEGVPLTAPDGYAAINKFQKTETLVAQLVQQFELASGQVGPRPQGTDAALLIGVYSPAGGAGKTALSLLLSRAFAQSGARVFYCNMELIGSFPRAGTPDMSLSRVLLALQTKGANLELSIRANMMQDEGNGIYLFAAPESSLEWNEVDADAKLTLLSTLVGMGSFDVVVADFDGELHGEKLSLLTRCDHVLAPVTEDDSARRKANALETELSLHAAEYSALAGRIVYLTNKTAQGSPQSIAYDAVYATLDQCWNRAPIPPVLLGLTAAWGKR